MTDDLKSTHKRATVSLTARALSQADIPAIISFQETVQAGIKVKDRLHVPSSRTAEYLRDHLNSGMQIAGVLDQDKVVGFCLVTFADSQIAEFLDNYKIAKPAETVILQSLLLDPAYLRHDVFTKVYDIAFDLAQSTGQEIAVINTAQMNRRILTGTERIGFVKYGEGVNHLDLPIVYLKRDLTPSG